MKKCTFLLLLLMVLTSMTSLMGQPMSFSSDSVISTGYTPWTIVCADFDADSFLDIAVGIDNESIFDPTAIYLNDGSGILLTTADSLYQNTNGRHISL